MIESHRIFLYDFAVRNIFVTILIAVFSLTVFHKGLALTFNASDASRVDAVPAGCFCTGAPSADKDVQYKKFIIKSDCDSKERLNYLSLLKCDFISPQTAAAAVLPQATGRLPFEDLFFQSAILPSPGKVPKA